MTEQRCKQCGAYYEPQDENDLLCQCCKDEMEESGVVM